MKTSSFLAAFAVLSLGILSVGCGDKTAQTTDTAGTSGTTAPAASGAPEGKGMVIAVIPKGLTHVFWQSVKSGAEKAASEGGATIKWDGPQKEGDASAQVGIVETQINSHVDGIVLAPLDKAALVKVIDKAHAANIPLTIIDSAADTENYLSFVATDNKKGGSMAAERMGKLLNGKGTVAMIPVQPNSDSTGNREAGFEETIKAKFPGITVIKSSYGMSDRAISLKVTEDVLTAHPDIAAIFGPNESSTVGALQALKTRKLLGKIKLVGFDATDQLIDSLNAGDIDSLVLQNPTKMGYEGVKTIIESKAGKTPEKRIDTGVALMTKDNQNTPEIQAALAK